MDIKRIIPMRSKDSEKLWRKAPLHVTFYLKKDKATKQYTIGIDVPLNHLENPAFPKFVHDIKNALDKLLKKRREVMEEH